MSESSALRVTCPVGVKKHSCNSSFLKAERYSRRCNPNNDLNILAQLTDGTLTRIERKTAVYIQDKKIFYQG